MRKTKTTLMLTAAAIALLAGAVEYVDIDARGGKIVSGPEKVYRITTATGMGSGVGFEASENTVSVMGIRQEQNETAAVLELGAAQRLEVGTLAIGAVQKGMTVGESLGWGEVAPTNGAEYIELDAGAADSGGIAVKSRMTTGVTAGEPQNMVLKRGEGEASLAGEFSVVVKNVEGKMRFAGAADGAATVSGEGAVFAASTAGRTDEELKIAAKAVNDFNEKETVFETSEPTAITGFRVINGSVAVCRGAGMFDRDVVTDPGRYEEDVPACVSVGSNTVGILKVEGSSLSGKVTIGGGESQGARSYGAIYAEDGAAITNYCSTIGEVVFAKAGYGHVYVGEGSEMQMCGTWQSGGQFAMVIDGGTLGHCDSEWRTSGFTIGAAGSVASVRVTNDGLFDATGAADGAAAVSGMATAAQFTIDEGGTLALGENRLTVGGSATLNLNEGGTMFAAGIDGGENAIVQFDGGTLVAQADGASLFAGTAVAQAGGAKIEVPEGMTVDLGSPIVDASGKGVDSIAMPAAMAGERFAGPPVVQISGVRGATAVCEFDNAAHAVTGIKVTGRGIFGGSTVSATVAYGTGAERKSYVISGNDIVTSKNISGGLVKSGAGELRITAKCTYTGETSVVGGTLKLAVEDAIKAGGSINLTGGAVLDLADNSKNWLRCSNLRGDGTGKVVNGTLTVTGLQVDMEKVKAGIYDTINMTNVTFDSAATIRLEGATDATLDRDQEYVLYAFVDGEPERMPTIDASTYAAGLSEGWGIEIKERKAVLRYFGGSIFIYY